MRNFCEETQDPDADELVLYEQYRKIIKSPAADHVTNLTLSGYLRLEEASSFLESLEGLLLPRRGLRHFAWDVKILKN